MPPLKRAWTLVQHSGFGYGNNPQFERAVEEKQINGALEIRRVAKAGGVIITAYKEAHELAEAENYPPGVQGIVPCAQGEFSPICVEALRIYKPKFLRQQDDLHRLARFLEVPNDDKY